MRNNALMAIDVGPQKSRLLAYGIERKGLTPPSNAIDSHNYSLSFEPFSTTKRLNEFDGVLVFQGIFESFVVKDRSYSGSYLVHKCEKDELDKRNKELHLLLQKGGFVCFMLCDVFIDRDKREDFQNSDLAKVFLNFPGFSRDNFSSRLTALHVLRDEFKQFLQFYGAANTYFSDHNQDLNLRILAKCTDKIVSMILFDNLFFIPCLMPGNNPDRVNEYFKLLCDALVATRKKIQVEIPDWINEFRFQEESKLLDKKDLLLAEIEDLNTKLTNFERYKRVLLFDGDQLVDSVEEILTKGFKFKIDSSDEFKEDLKIVNEEGTPIVFVEIKGTNGGVKREYVNQADSHRERAELDSSFPSILIINTHIKNSRSLDEKNKEVPNEHIVHAKKINVLVLRTYDLLQLLKLHLMGAIDRDAILDLLTTESGWLRVMGDEIKVISE